jgi:acetyltransferase-like isoleucine patch superfamily enzyme
MQEKKYKVEYEAFGKMIIGERIPATYLFILIIKSCLALFEMCIRYIPGGFGYAIRYFYYKFLLKKLGRNVLIDVGVFLNGPANISIGDYSWIDAGCRIEAILGEITIGKRVHIAPYSILGAREPIIIEDYVAIASGVKIYSNSEHPIDGKRMSGPMIPEQYKAFHSKKIIIKKDSFIGANSVLLPGSEIDEGAVVGANSVISQKIEAYNIVVGSPIRVLRKRGKVTVPDI